jgi:hypothetical protein
MVLIMMEPSLFLGKIFSLTGEKFFSLRGENSGLPFGFLFAFRKVSVPSGKKSLHSFGSRA